ncbi:MAG: hypothetical protein ACTHKU_06915, partial [Verrucomicrobiota bacterium]
QSAALGINRSGRNASISNGVQYGPGFGGHSLVDMQFFDSCFVIQTLKNIAYNPNQLVRWSAVESSGSGVRQKCIGLWASRLEADYPALDLLPTIRTSAFVETWTALLVRPKLGSQGTKPMVRTYCPGVSRV